MRSIGAVSLGKTAERSRIGDVNGAVGVGQPSGLGEALERGVDLLAGGIGHHPDLTLCQWDRCLSDPSGALKDRGDPPVHVGPLEIVDHAEQDLDGHHQQERDMMHHRRIARRHLVHCVEGKIQHRGFDVPTMNGAQLTRRLLSASPATQILIFTMHDSEQVVHEVLSAGARGVILKSDADAQLMAAVEAMTRRQPYFTKRISEQLLKLYLSQPLETSEGGLLTPREREVVQLIAEGNSSKHVGKILGVSLKTVESHRAAIMRKLGLDTTAALVRYAIRNKLIEP